MERFCQQGPCVEIVCEGLGQEPAAVSPADARAPAKHNQRVWEQGRAERDQQGAGTELQCSKAQAQFLSQPDLLA